ncbi:hypothetical protein ACFLSQ_04665 [Bacteroidota bacterium]
MRIAAIFLLFIIAHSSYGQVEHVTVAHPVYNYLIRMETRGMLPHFSSSVLPLQRKDIMNALSKIESNKDELSNSEKAILDRYLIEFEITNSHTAVNRKNAVVIYSPSDSTQVFSREMIGEKEKFIYYYRDSVNKVNISPLGSLESLFSDDDNVILGNLGVRLYGSLGEHFGYYLQATNGAVISGNRDLALREIHKLKQNVKFADLNSDFDFSESHIRFDYEWFYAILGHETRLVGSGIANRLFISPNAPPGDALTLGAKFNNFEYRYSHTSILAADQANYIAGFNTEFPDKYLVTHRFALKPAWGEISFWEGIIYSKRGIDLAYLSPLSFFKSLEHALHDRDNSLMGGDITIRPIDRIQLKGSFLLDDIKFGEIGKGYWSNKTAWNLGIMYASPLNIDFAVEYARVEPYTFTHFDSINSYTNDEMLIGTGLLPNSDETSFILRYWWGNRYPVSLKVSYMRHGSNIYADDGTLERNVGGNPFQTRRPEDSETVTFLDGDLQEGWNYELIAGWEIVRGFNIKVKYISRESAGDWQNVYFISFGFEDF